MTQNHDVEQAKTIAGRAVRWLTLAAWATCRALAGAAQEAPPPPPSGALSESIVVSGKPDDALHSQRGSEPRGAEAGLYEAAAQARLDPLTDPAGRSGKMSMISAPTPAPEQSWNWHAQNTDIVQGDLGFPARYSGPNSLARNGQVQETVTLDLYAGVRLWTGAEAHMDLLMWQGFGLSQTFGIEGFPNGDAYKAGTRTPYFTFARLFVRQTIGFGGPKEDVPDDQITLAGKRDTSRLTFTIGRFSPLDICDNNTYARDQHRQFMNWAMMGNLTWDYGQDTIGFTTGVAVEINQPKWALRYGFFQMPRDKNGFTGDDQFLMWPHHGAYGPFLRSWAMMTEFERRYGVNGHSGAIRFLTWLDKANMASYQVATAILLANPPGPDVGQGAGVTIPPAAHAYRYKYGFGLNWEQEAANNVGMFSRLGWTDGHNETWTFTDADWSASLGVSVKGEAWRRPYDTFGLAGIASGASRRNQRFLATGGTDMLDGDGNLNYGWERVLETYYDLLIFNNVHAALDYQFITAPAFNRDRGPVSVFAVRLHWEV
jgi:high affinity Mn2+ porin